MVEPPGKSAAGYRLYDKDSVRRIHFIKHAQNCGFTLAELCALLVLRGRDKACCGDVRTRAVEKDSRDEGDVQGAECAKETLRGRLVSYSRFDNWTARTIVGIGPTETATGSFASDLVGARLEGRAYSTSHR